MTGTGVTFSGFGHYAPEMVVANAEIESRLGLDAGWIERRTGILERRHASDGEALSDLAIAAGKKAIADSGVAPEDIALLVLATSTPDHLLPPTAPLVAHRLGFSGAGAIDMAGACAGFIYALAFAESFVQRQRRSALVVAANILSRRTNRDERASAILFGDGAGAVVVSPTESSGSGLKGIKLMADGSGYGLIQIPAGGSRNPFHNALSDEDTRMHLADGQAVFQRAVNMMVEASNAALEQAGLSIDNIDIWVPHQANRRIMRAVTERLQIAPEKMASTVECFANSSAATIPLTLSQGVDRAKLRRGSRILMAAAGAGMTGGAAVFEM